MDSQTRDIETFYRSQSFWLDSVPGSLSPRPSLEGNQRADVVIVGAGFTGLWTAYYLNKHAPGLDIAVLEAEIAGFGASGRNGGWCTPYVAGLGRQLHDPATRAAAIRLERLMSDTVDEVGRVAERESIDCHFDKQGHVSAATLPAHLHRDIEEIKFLHSIGYTEDDIRMLEPDELKSMVNVENALGGHFMAQCAPIHPARLARGLADVLERKGVRIYEQSPVSELGSGPLHTPNGSLTSEKTLLATEGSTRSLGDVQPHLIPIHSTMIATEPLSDKEITTTGLTRRCTWNNGKHLVTYGHLTADGRIAFGSRGGYLYASGIQREYRLDDPAFEIVADELAQIFPVLRGKRVTHAWGGAMGVSRSMTPAVCYDSATRVGWAGGYFGDGVGATNLAGRTLADLALGRGTERSRALWVNPEREKSLVRRLWEPEPVRWLGISTRAKWMGWTDRAEARGGDAKFMNFVLDRVFPG